jgi:hypothetical protein
MKIKLPYAFSACVNIENECGNRPYDCLHFFLPSMLFRTLLAPLVMTLAALLELFCEKEDDALLDDVLADDGVDVIDDFREELAVVDFGVVPIGDTGERGDFGVVAVAEAAGFELSEDFAGVPALAAAALLTAGDWLGLSVVGLCLAELSVSWLAPLTGADTFLTGVEALSMVCEDSFLAGVVGFGAGAGVTFLTGVDAFSGAGRIASVMVAARVVAGLLSSFGTTSFSADLTSGFPVEFSGFSTDLDSGFCTSLDDSESSF